MAVALWGRGAELGQVRAAGDRSSSSGSGLSGERPRSDPALDGAQELLAGGHLEAALEAYEALVADARASDDLDRLAESLNGLGLVYKRLGDYHQAISLYSSALETCKGLGRKTCQATAEHNLGACYTLLGDLKAARDALDEALELWPERAYERTSTLTAIATLEDLEGDHEEAIRRYREALVLRHLLPQANARERRYGLGATLDRLATAFQNAGRLQEARRAYEQALAIWRRDGHVAELGVTSDNLGWLSLELGDARTALEHLATALPLLTETGTTHDRAHVLLGLARAQRQLGDLDAASADVEEALGIIESLRSTSFSHHLRASFLAQRQPFYELYVEILMEQHTRKPKAGFERRALEVAERFRARGLLDLLSLERKALRGAADGDARGREEQLHRQMAARERQRLDLVRRSAPAAEIADVERAQRELALRYDQLRAEQWAEQGTAPESEPLTASEMTSLLDADTVLLVYSLGVERSFLWQVDAEGVVAHQLPDRDQIERQAWQVYSYLQASDQRAGQEEGRASIQALSDLLLGPVAGSLGKKRLVIMADGLIHYISFAALPAGDGRPLVADHEIVSLPSMSVLETLRDRAARRPMPAKTLLVMADPVFRRDDPRAAGVAVSAEGRDSRASLAPDRLERSGLEAEAILDLVYPDDRRGVLGFDATRHFVLEGGLAGYRIVHIATHGELNDEQPEYTHLVLSLLDEQGHPVEGRLYQHEIGDLDIQADLVVLSACNSALGKNVRGEGLMGMTRGFMNAGATRVIVSLWYVSEEATSMLMERFYTALLVEGKSPPAALQEAQLYLQTFPQWESPFFWAGFVLQGEWR